MKITKFKTQKHFFLNHFILILKLQNPVQWAIKSDV